MYNPQIETLIQVADAGSFSKAAQQLFVTPASIMKHINTLENRLGVTLVVRSRRGTELTAAGRALYEGGKKLAASADRLAREVNRYIARGGMLILEVGEGQAAEVLRLFEKRDYAIVMKDLEGQDRFLKIAF